MNSTPQLDHDDKRGMRALADLPGLEAVSQQLAGRIENASLGESPMRVAAS